MRTAPFASKVSACITTTSTPGRSRGHSDENRTTARGTTNASQSIPKKAHLGHRLANGIVVDAVHVLPMGIKDGKDVQSSLSCRLLLLSLQENLYSVEEVLPPLLALEGAVMPVKQARCTALSPPASKTMTRGRPTLQQVQGEGPHCSLVALSAWPIILHIRKTCSCVIGPFADAWIRWNSQVPFLSDLLL